MSMEDWSSKLDIFCNSMKKFNDSATAGNTIAKSFAESKFEKYRIM